MAGFVVSQADYLIGDAIRKERARIIAALDAAAFNYEYISPAVVDMDDAIAIVNGVSLAGEPPSPQEQQR